MSFFTKSTSQKRKRTDPSSVPAARKRQTTASAPRGDKTRASRKDREESISDVVSSDEDGSILGDDAATDATSGDEAENETAAEKRLRLAEQYLENLREEVDEAGFDAADIDRDLIAERLQEDVAESKGKVYRHIAANYDFEAANSVKERRDFKTLTGVATHGKFAYTVSKDMMLVKWEIADLSQAMEKSSSQELTNGVNGDTQHKGAKFQPRRKPRQIHFVRGKRNQRDDPKYQGHTNAILCVACSPDGNFLATGGRDRKLIIWDTTTMKPLRVFTQHRGAVNAVAFRRGTNQLFSASSDRSIKVWSLDELAYIETLFGHQDEVLDVDALAEEKCVTVGARDRTARLWKVVEEQQLLFRGVGVKDTSKSKYKDRPRVNGATQPATEEPKQYPENTIDRITLLSHEIFVTGSSNGSLSLWNINKKKPIFVYSQAHGLDPPLPAELTSAEEDPLLQISYADALPRYITALRAIPYSDLFLTGSWDGWVRAWRVKEEFTEKGKRTIIEAAGVLGRAQLQSHIAGAAEERLIDGVVNDISVVERGDRGKDGLTVLAAVGTEHRLGSWAGSAGGRNAIWVFEVPPAKKLEVGKDREVMSGMDDEQ